MFPLFFTSIAIKENSGKNYKVIRFIEMGGRVKPRKYWEIFWRNQTSPQHLSYNYLPLNDIMTLSALVSSQLIQLSFGYVKSSTPLQLYKSIQWGMELLSNLDPHHKMHLSVDNLISTDMMICIEKHSILNNFRVPHASDVCMKHPLQLLHKCRLNCWNQSKIKLFNRFHFESHLRKVNSHRITKNMVNFIPIIN